MFWLYIFIYFWFISFIFVMQTDLFPRDRNSPRGAHARGHQMVYRTYNYHQTPTCAVCQRLLLGKFFQVFPFFIL
jgi:hypothetical protein